ncbi:hypothetical protein AVEN_162592-1 [Araneus ventricosus]|uniref:Uncharacterized protein n=1 Tax=Araneus ventricosus TaxID=182803 RepID=A0A4Y2QT39_ARAVE|nr:hypothetical protein AVEN_167013-1 [Araneus ventricosus]GBN65388.1 hypothetical protein AVEN_177801-1 [Araneus ventricosus]GBN66483.1 hypothetical protein AVEN_231884-1 [Araneus ventricosus]GBN66497.1 hypothetical protein AVEN_162592-1 [Araneus ventricosus]
MAAGGFPAFPPSETQLWASLPLEILLEGNLTPFIGSRLRTCSGDSLDYIPMEQLKCRFDQHFLKMRQQLSRVFHEDSRGKDSKGIRTTITKILKLHKMCYTKMSCQKPLNIRNFDITIGINSGI